jgi:pimeloyl-ACP methyl ester carboxylesterase
MRRSLILVIPAILLAAGLLTLSYTLPYFIFRPDTLQRVDPRSWGLLTSRHVRFPSPDGSMLSAWWTPPAEAGAPIVLVAHGRSGNISARTDLAKALTRSGLGSLMFDYRGYGASEGKPSEEGLYEDSLAAYEWLSARGVTPAKLIVLGQSLGNAPAARLAANRPVAGLVLVSPFTNLPEAASARFRWLPLGVIPWQHNRFEVADYLRQVSVPVMLVSSRADELVPFANAVKLRAVTRSLPICIDDERLPHNGLLVAVALDGRLADGIRRLAAMPPKASRGPASASKPRQSAMCLPTRYRHAAGLAVSPQSV